MLKAERRGRARTCLSMSAAASSPLYAAAWTPSARALASCAPATACCRACRTRAQERVHPGRCLRDAVQVEGRCAQGRRRGRGRERWRARARRHAARAPHAAAAYHGDRNAVCRPLPSHRRQQAQHLAVCARRCHWTLQAGCGLVRPEDTSHRMGRQHLWRGWLLRRLSAGKGCLPSEVLAGYGASSAEDAVLSTSALK